MMIAILIGTIGFPVLYELKREALTPRTWSLHTKLTLTGAAGIMVVGVLMTLPVRMEQRSDHRAMSAAEKLTQRALPHGEPTSGSTVST
jgi:trk system potassium uptake protein TrkH